MSSCSTSWKSGEIKILLLPWQTRALEAFWICLFQVSGPKPLFKEREIRGAARTFTFLAFLWLSRESLTQVRLLVPSSIRVRGMAECARNPHIFFAPGTQKSTRMEACLETITPQSICPPRSVEESDRERAHASPRIDYTATVYF